MNKIIVMGKTYPAVVNGRKRTVTAIILDQDGNVGPGIKTFNDKGDEIMTCSGSLREFNQAEHLYKTLKIVEEIKNFDKKGKVNFLNFLFYKKGEFDRTLFMGIFYTAHWVKKRMPASFEKNSLKKITRLVGRKKLEEILLTPADPAVVAVIEDYIHKKFKN